MSIHRRVTPYGIVFLCRRVAEAEALKRAQEEERRRQEEERRRREEEAERKRREEEEEKRRLLEQQRQSEALSPEAPAQPEPKVSSTLVCVRMCEYVCVCVYDHSCLLLSGGGRGREH